jgi:hypothetical protein
MKQVGVWLFVVSLPCLAQVNGRITGTVTDPSGAPVPNAQVEVLVAGGAKAILASKTNEAGLFSFASVRPEVYDVTVAAPGFAKASNRRVTVDSLRETALAIKLEVAGSEQIIEVLADAQTVQLTSAELATTVTRQQLEFLPTPSRQISTLFATQAGVSDARGPTVINGMRTSAANVTLDGINIQDNFIRTNSLDFMPFRPTIDQMSEVTIAVGNAASTVGGGAAQVSIVTRAGTNDFHGSAYWYNQNSKFGANEFFNNRSGVAKPFLNQNQPGATFSGRIIRDKLFFFGNWEEYRLKQQATQLRTVLTPEARSGLFRWNRGASSQNLLQARGISTDPLMAAALEALPLPNSTDAGDGLNTSGYRFNARSNTDRRQFVTRWDYYLNSNHNLTASYNFTHEVNDRPDISTRFYTTVPPNSTGSDRHFTSMAWRWTAGPTFTNDLRGGFALSPSKFLREGDNPPAIFTNSLYTNPVNDFLPQGRNTNTYSIQDNASWLKGRHDFSFGFQSQFIRTDPYNDGGIVPSYALGISANNTTGFTSAQLPGATAGDLTVANSLYSSLGGFLNTGTQTFNINSPTSGFVKGATNQRFLSYDTYAGYFQDRWKATRRLTVTLGLRYEYWTVLRERDNLFLLPGLRNGNVIDTLLDPLATFDFIGTGGRVMYKPDRNNFAPNIGFAFDPTGRGKTSIRGSYSISYFNDDAITAIRNNATTNSGLSATSSLAGLVARASAAPAIPAPAYKVPRTQADNYATDPAAALGIPDPNLRTPYIQQWSLGVQHELKGTVFELRYVGNHGTKLLRAFDYNQVIIKQNGFLEDTIRARNNAFLSERAGLGFNGAYTGPGSQPLTVYPQLSNSLLTNATIQLRLRQGEVGELGSLYQTNGLNGAVNFFQNRNALGANTIVNGGNSTYNGLQFDARRRMGRNGHFQVNYTFSKVLSDTAGDDQARFEPFLDLGNNDLERARAPFDLTHAIKSNASYALPFGKDQRWSAGNSVLNQIFGGWITNGVLTWQSGYPFSVFSSRGTLNRSARSTNRNTASTLLTKDQLDNTVFGLRKQGDGVFFVTPGTRFTDGRGVPSDGAAMFNGQAFYNPGPGEAGGLQRRMFSGPWSFSLDMGLVKRFAITERQTLEFRAEAFNITNTPSFNVASAADANSLNQDINNVNFGRITGVSVGSRYMQFGLYYRF